MGFDLVDPRAVACDEEARVASAVADIAADHVPWCGGVLCLDEAGTWANVALGCAMHGERVTARDVADLIDWYESRGIEPFVEACAYSDRSLLRRLFHHSSHAAGARCLTRRRCHGTDRRPLLR